MTPFFHFLKRDSRSSGTWTFRAIMAALGFVLMGFAFIEGSGFDSKDVNLMIVVLALILGVTASLATLDAFRGNAWRETLELVRLTRMRIGELFLLKLVTRFIPILLGFLPMLGLFFLVLEIHDVSASLGIRCLYLSCCAVLFGISVGMETSCHSNQATFWVNTAGNNTLRIWVVCLGLFYLIDQLVTSFLTGFSFQEVMPFIFIILIFHNKAELLSWIFRSVFDSRLGKQDRLKLVVLLTIPLFVCLLPLFPGSAPRFYVFPAVLASSMAAIAFVYVHFASQMVKDADYLLKNSRWRFLVPPLKIIRQDRVRQQAKLRKKLRLNRPLPSVKPIPTTDPTPSRPGIWADLFLSKDGAENVSPPTIQSQIAISCLWGGLHLAVVAVTLTTFIQSDHLNHLSYVLFVAWIEFCVFFGIMVRASGVLSGERRSGILELLLVSPCSSRVITEGVLHAFAGIRNAQSLLLIICELLILIFAHIGLFLGRGSYDWGLFLYVPISLALCRFHRFRFLWIISCRDGLRYDRSIAASLTLRFLTVIVVPYGIFLSCFFLIANEPIRLSLCFLFPVLHWSGLDRLAARSRNDLHDMARVIRA